MRAAKGASKPHTRTNPDFPLRVFVRCACCRTPLTGSWSRGRKARYAYYSCRQCGRVRAPRERLERLFLERLRALQPNQAYMRLFNAIVGDVWREQEAEARRLRKDTERCLADVDRRVDQLERAYIFEKRIDQGTYERQKDKLRAESTLLEIQLNETRIDELDVEALLAFAEYMLTDAARMWAEAPITHKQQLQRVFFPQGLDFDGEQFGTAVTCLAFREFGRNSDAEDSVASPTGTAQGCIRDFSGEAS